MGTAKERMVRTMTKQRILRRIKRADQRIADLTSKKNESRLNEHGYWSLGYWIGVVNVLEDWLDELDGKGECE